MKLRPVYARELPRLAWIARVDPVHPEVVFIHGRDVEPLPTFFVEGIWDGPFSDGGIAHNECFFGSGGEIDRDGITFVSSGSTVDYLYYGDRREGIFVSNSLPLLLCSIEDRLRPDYLRYAELNRTIMRGIANYDRRIPTMHGHVNRLMFHNLRINGDGIREVQKPPAPCFDSYSTYTDYLSSSLSNLVDNARACSRTTRLRLFSTQSRGYDTTAINSLMARHHLDNVFSCPEAKESGSFYLKPQSEYESDDGSEICNVLGIPCTPIDRRSFEHSFPGECLYWAGIHRNTDMNLIDIHDYIKEPAVFLTGVLGEIWYTREATPSTRLETIDEELKRWDLSGHGLSEVRLHAGFIHLPVPYIGARRRSDIFRITESDDMRPWRLGGDYDRPIARRMAEESGVPRELFGRRKLATIVDFPMPSVPFSEPLRNQFFEFLQDYGLLGRFGRYLVPVVHGINNYICWRNLPQRFHDYENYRFHYYAGRLFLKLTGHQVKISRFWRHIDGSLFCFCVNRVAKDYQIRMGEVMQTIKRRSPGD